MEKNKFDKTTLKRLFSDYVFKYYKFRFFIVLVLVVISALVGVASSLFIENLIDDYITPMLSQSNPNFVPLIKALSFMACVYMVGIVSNYVHQRMMARISQRNIKGNS